MSHANLGLCKKCEKQTDVQTDNKDVVQVFQPEHAGSTQSKYYLQYFQIGKTIESIVL